MINIVIRQHSAALYQLRFVSVNLNLKQYSDFLL